MKKLFFIFFILILIVCFAEAEADITFNNIPWLTDDSATIQALKEAGYVRDGINDFNMVKKNPIYIVEDDEGLISPNRITGVEEVTFTAELNEGIKGQIAGHPVKNLTMTFAYDGAYKLIAVKVDLIKANYGEIKDKLIKVYGEGEEKNTEEGINSIVWTGENNTAVLLYTQSDGFNYTLLYGRTDAVEILLECLTYDPDDVSGL